MKLINWRSPVIRLVPTARAHTTTQASDVLRLLPMDGSVFTFGNAGYNRRMGAGGGRGLLWLAWARTNPARARQPAAGLRASSQARLPSACRYERRFGHNREPLYARRAVRRPTSSGSRRCRIRSLRRSAGRCRIAAVHGGPAGALGLPLSAPVSMGVGSTLAALAVAARGGAVTTWPHLGRPESGRIRDQTLSVDVDGGGNISDNVIDESLRSGCKFVEADSVKQERWAGPHSPLVT